jgi:hypothetical protein
LGKCAKSCGRALARDPQSNGPKRAAAQRRSAEKPPRYVDAIWAT